MSKPDSGKGVASRLTVTEVVYHFAAGQNPVGLPARVQRPLASDEQAWSRRLHVGDQWQRLELGWVTRPAYLRVSNEEGRGGARLADEQRAARTVELAVRLDQGPSPGSTLVVTDVIPPGDDVRRLPPDAAALWLRCRQGRALVHVVAVQE